MNNVAKMRFLKTKLSQNKIGTVYEFSFGKEELKILRDLVFLARKSTLNITETTQFRSRLSNIVKEFDRTLNGFYENKK